MYNHKSLYYQKREELRFSSVVEILSCMCEALKKRKWRKGQRRGNDRNQGQNNCKAINQRGGQSLEAENVKVIDSYLEHREGKQPEMSCF